MRLSKIQGLFKDYCNKDLPTVFKERKQFIWYFKIQLLQC